MAEARLRRFAEGFSLLEVPRWHDGQLWVADMYGGRVLAFAADGSVQTAVDVPGTPTGLGWLHDGRLLVLLRERRLLRLEPCGLVEVCDLAEIGSAVPDELSVDAGGRVYVGVFGLASGGLVRVDPDGTTSRVTADLLLPNGQAITPDGQMLIVAESAGQRLTAFTLMPGGTLCGRRTWASFGEPATAASVPEALAQVQVWPDGITLDAAGAAWVAGPLGREVFRVREGGQITDRISTPGARCVACALGGPDGPTLFLCTAPQGSTEAQLRANRQAALLTARVATPAAAASHSNSNR